MTKKERIDEIIAEIANLQMELDTLNPYYKLLTMSNKAFGEGWSEKWILSKVPNLSKNNGAGHDMKGVKYQNIEVKSSRKTFDEAWTQNQIHPSQADAYLFVWYNCETGEEEICLIPTVDFMEKCSLSKQHGEGCYSMRNTRQNHAILSCYLYHSWEELNEAV